MPLDLFLHHDLPRGLAGAFSIEVLTANRLIGAIEAALLAGFAVGFARALDLAGGAAFATASVALLGGGLGLFTGYGKAFSELSLATAAIAMFSMRAVQGRGGLLGLGIAVAAGFLVHRAAVAFVPPLAVSLAFALRRDPQAWRRPAAITGLAAAAIALLAMAPKLIAAFAGFDRAHLSPEGGGIARAWSLAVQLIRLADLIDTTIVLAPLALAIPALLLVLRGLVARRAIAVALLALALPLALSMVFVHPKQGMFRDWDVFAAAGVALSMVAAWLVGETLRSGSRDWLAVAVALGVAVPPAQWLLLQHDVPSGLARVEAYLVEPPPRSPGEQALNWSFLHIRQTGLGRYPEAAAAAARAAAFAPSPRLLYEWASAEAARGDLVKAREVLLRLIDKAETMPDAWSALATVSEQLGDSAGARRAAERLLELSPGNRRAIEILGR
jgi:tetratricopeptide (TPR) repeat protein